MADPSKDPIYVFDSDCVLCSRAVQYVLKYEKQPDMKFVAIKSELGREISKLHNVDPDDPHTFIYLQDGKAWFSSDAGFAVLRKTGGPWAFLRMCKILPRPIRDWLYFRIARNRYKVFGKLETCYVPTPETRDRFVLS